jgi:ribosomal-protein-alanine N-acetyltransferase
MNLPPYSIFPTLTGDSISLRAITTEDLQEIVAISFYDAVQAGTVAEAAIMQARINTDYLEGNSIHWGIVDKLSDKIVGTCGFYRGLDKGEGELGCVLLPQYYKRGYMTAAMALAIDFGLHTIGLRRIWAITSQQNTAAIQLLERLNFIKVADLADNEIEYELR